MQFDETPYRFLKFKREGHVLTTILNRPGDFRNAFNPELQYELGRFLFDICYDDEIRAVVLTGEGKAFSAGGDMNVAGPTPSRFAREALASRHIVFGLLDCPKIIICRMNGDAVGLGATIALLCDFVIAAETARIGDPHVKMGLVAGDGGALIWPQLVGAMRAKQFLLTGDLIHAPEAEKLGLITKSVGATELDQEVDKLVQKIVSGAPLALEWTKRSANAHLRVLASTQFDLSLGYEGVSALSRDHVEASSAFIAKRKPKFEGN